MVRIIKLDKSLAVFNKNLVKEAVLKAFLSEGFSGVGCADKIAHYVEQMVYSAKEATVTVKDIQNLVENLLMKDNPTVARAYIEYRHDRDKARETSSDLFQNISGLVNQTNKALMNENANKEATLFSTQRDLLAGEVAKHFALKYLLPKNISEAHLRGDLHFHDLDYFPLMGMTNCCLVDLEGMLKNGFKMGNARIETPNSIQTAATIVSQIAAAVANSQYGGTSFDRLDEVLAPFVTKTFKKERAKIVSIYKRLTGDTTKYLFDELTKMCIDSEARIATEKAVFDACQTLEYQVNTIYCTNGQTPFLTFGFGMGTSWEARLVQKGILQNRIDGLGVEKVTAIFPKLVFGIKDGLNLKEGDPNYDIKRLALKCASLRMYPDILNYEKTVEITGGYKAPMGCRSFLSKKIINGKEVYSGRNNLGVVSVNVTKAAVEAKGDLNSFWDILETQVGLAKEALEYRLERLATVKAKSAPILYIEGAFGLRLDPEELVLPHLLERGASLSLGYVGLEEAACAMFGTEVHTFDSKEKTAFIKNVLYYLDTKVSRWKEDSGVHYSLYGTPSESLCNRFCKIIKDAHGDLKGVTDKGYLTNSFHLDVMKEVNPYDKIDFEMKFVLHSSGGHICYGEYPNLKHNLEALENVWDYSYYRVPYYGTNTPIDECFKCGFKGEFYCTSRGFTCPKCGNRDPQTVSVTRRVCGYLGNPDSRPFNTGKQAEMEKRVKHM